MATQLTSSYRVPASPAPAMGYMDKKWYRSPKVNGKLLLQPQPFQYVKNSQRVLRSSYADQPINGWSVLPKFLDAANQTSLGPGSANSASGGYDAAFWNALQNATYSKFFSLVKSDKAGLGIGLLEAGKSFRMITDRVNKVSRMLSDKESTLWAHRRIIRRRLGKTPTSWRDVLQARASDILEGEFGWAPLISDSIATMRILANGVPYSPWIRASRKQRINSSTLWVDNTYYKTSESWEGSARCTYAAKVTVSNPNLWLLNQLGLINPVTTALDKVPWSWVLSMFLNFNQVLNSFTDDIGVTITDLSVTRTREVTHVQQCLGVRFYYNPLQTDLTRTVLYEKYRTVGGAIPRPTLNLHWPKADWNLALIASAVMLQRVNSLNATVAKLFGVKPPSL